MGGIINTRLEDIYIVLVVELVGGLNPRFSHKRIFVTGTGCR